MEKDTITVIQKLPNEEAKIVQIDKSLNTLQTFVKGPIGMIEMPKQTNADLIFNDNFLYEDIERNQVHNMSVIGAFRYAKVMKDNQEAEDQAKKEIEVC